MKKQICSLTTEQVNPQAILETWIDQVVQNLIARLTEKVLELKMHPYLQANWNERAATDLRYCLGCAVISQGYRLSLRLFLLASRSAFDR